MMRSAAALVAVLFLVSCRETVLHNLDEKQANQVWLVLARGNVDAEKRQDSTGWSIAVPRGEIAPALTVLEKARLPRSLPEEKGSSSLIPSREERELMRERQLAARLEQTFEALPGVIEARVHLVLPPAPEGRDPAKASSAGVLLVTTEEFALEPKQLKEIVAGASGVTKENIAIALTILRQDSNGEKKDTPPALK